MLEATGLRTSGLTLDPRIVKARAAVLRAEEARDAVIAAVQAECPHSHVVATAGYQGLAVYFKPTRRCLACGLQEGGQGAPWVSWYEGAGSALADAAGRDVVTRWHDMDPRRANPITEGK